MIKVKVEEEATGELAFSAGFSSADAFLFSVSAQQRNFRGRGQYLSARIQTTSRQQDLEFRFTEPKFQDRNMAVGFDLFLTQSDFFDEAGFKNSIIGAGAPPAVPAVGYRPDRPALQPAQRRPAARQRSLVGDLHGLLDRRLLPLFAVRPAGQPADLARSAIR